MAPKTKLKPKPKPKTKSTPEVNPLQKYFDRLNDDKKFILVKPEFMKDLPIQTHIGYVYQSSKGDIIPVISAFIQSHYVTEGGLSGMMIKCGNRTYANLYQSILRIYVYTKDYKDIIKVMHYNTLYNPPKPSPEEMAIRIQQLEKTLMELKVKLTRSTSTVQLSDKKSKPDTKVSKKEPSKPSKRPSSLTHIDRKKSKPVIF
jgi:hypothetical protein